jgi:hypothetical protein
MENTKPQLIEPGIKSYITHSLQKCNEFKTKYYNRIINISLFLAFVVLIGTICYIKYKGKLTEEELEVKSLQKKYYILEKIKSYQDARKIAQQELITGLPSFNYP